jgi:hypothetical protein
VALTFSDDGCDIPLKVDGDTAVAATDTCKPKRGTFESFKITKQLIESMDGKQAKLAFEAGFHAHAQSVENGMSCTIVASSRARRL